MGDGGCSVEARGTELLACTRASDCACPQRCVQDPGAGTTLCELPCSGPSDCSSAVTHCVAEGPASLCAINYCQRTLSGASAVGTFGGACGASAPDAGDGTCIPSFNGETSAAFGFCVPSGTAQASCNPATADNPNGAIQGVSAPGSSRAPPSDYCGAGAACVTTTPGNGSCEDFCLTAKGGCQGTAVCLAQDPGNTAWGLCAACIQSGQACLLNSDCCTGSCSLSNGCAGGCDPTSPQGC